MVTADVQAIVDATLAPLLGKLSFLQGGKGEESLKVAVAEGENADGKESENGADAAAADDKAAEEAPDYVNDDNDYPPTPNTTFVIRVMNEPKALTTVDGNLSLLDFTPDRKYDRSFHWLCLCQDGWLMFKNVVTGSFLSLNDEEGEEMFKARYDHRRPLDCILPRRHCKGGYEIYAAREDNLLRRMIIDGQLSASRGEEEALYRFIRV